MRQKIDVLQIIYCIETNPLQYFVGPTTPDSETDSSYRIIFIARVPSTAGNIRPDEVRLDMTDMDSFLLHFVKFLVLIDISGFRLNACLPMAQALL